MANKTLHSLQFPGLSDVYVVPEDAQEFSSESTYAVGEFVTYQGVLYKCTTAVTTAGSWTGATNWSATDVGSELEDTYGPSRPNFSVNNPVMDGSASPGSATTYARSDHVHPSDTSKLDIPENSGTAGQVLTRTASGSIWQTQSSGGEIIADASNSYSVTLYANSWTTQEQLIATPTGAQITSTSDGVLGLSPNATAAQVEAFQLAKIIVISQSSSGVVVKALGIVPTINLPCELMLFMKADYYTKDYIDTYMAPLDTPTFIGVPKAPTAAAGTNTTQIATTAFVEQAKNTRVPVYGMGKNLLENWYFLHPVNQRGQTVYTAPGGSNYYTIDRWMVYSAGTKFTISADGVSIGPKTDAASSTTQYLAAAFSEYAERDVTISCLLADGSLMSASGTIPATVPSSNTTLLSAYGPSGSSGYFVRLGYNNRFYFIAQTPQNTTLTMVAVKLEFGTQQTLCHNEGTDANPVWVLNEVPDYEYELYRCMTSTADSTDTYANKSLATGQQLAYVENGTTATKPNGYAVGEYFCWHGALYKARTAIGNGDTFTENTNCLQISRGGLNDISQNIIRGTVKFGRSEQSRDVFFNVTFLSPPTVVATFVGAKNTVIAQVANSSIYVESTTTTSCKLNIDRTTLTAEVVVNYIAIGDIGLVRNAI